MRDDTMVGRYEAGAPAVAHRRLTLRRVVGLLTIAGSLTAAACTPATGSGGTTTTSTTTTTFVPPPFNVAPVINSFTAGRPSGPSPLTTGLQISVSDANHDPLVCRLDLDSNGTTDLTIFDCGSNSIRSATFSTEGTQTITLSVSDGTAPDVTATTQVTVGAATSDQFNITLRLDPGLTASQTAAFTSAAARWSQVIKTGLADVTTTIKATDCTGAVAFSGTIDDVLIDASIAPIDGVGAILGQAGPCFVRTAGGLPLYGVMKFDSADVAALETSGQLNAVILHEMGHVLGFGTVWSPPLLTGSGTSDPEFTGLTAQGAYQAIGGTGTVPVENSGGAGTANSHWRESVFNSELMTGYLGAGPAPLSALTIASLADLGYGVDLTAADSYFLGSLRAAGPTTQTELNIQHIVPRAKG